MRFTLSILIWLLLCPLSAYLQTIAKDGYKSEQIIYEGKIVDKETGEILPFANVTHIYELDSLIVRNYIADKEGRFKISVPRLMNNRIEITCMGYKILTRILNEAGKGSKKFGTTIQFQSTQNPIYNQVDLGVLKLEPDVHALDEVVVKARLKLFQYSGDTLLVFPRNVKQMEGDALIDLLKRHPSFRVNANGDIYVDGKKIERAMLNGKHIFGEQVKTMVNSIMAKEAGLIKVYDEIDEVSEIIHGGSEKTRKRKVMNVITFKDFNLFKGGEFVLESGMYSEKDREGDHPLMRNVGGNIGQYHEKFRISGKGNYSKVYYPKKQKDALLGFNTAISTPDLLEQILVTYDYKQQNLNQNSWTELLYRPTSYFEEQISVDNRQLHTKKDQHLYRIEGKFVKKKKFAVEFDYNGSFSKDNQYHLSASEIERDGQKLSSLTRKKEFTNQNYNNHLHFRVIPSVGKAGSIYISFDGRINKGEGDGMRIDSSFTNGIINKRIYTQTSDKPETRMEARISYQLNNSFDLSNTFNVNYGRSGNRNFSVDQYTEAIDSILSRDQVNKDLSLSYRLGFSIIPHKVSAHIIYAHIEEQIEERFPLLSLMKKRFNTINYGISLYGLRKVRVEYSTSDNRVPVHYFSNRLNDNDRMNLSGGNPNLKMGKTHTVNIQPIIKHIEEVYVYYKYITNPILLARRYFPEHTLLSEYGNYEILAGSTLSLPINSSDYHQLHFTSSFNIIKHGPILWRTALVYEFENPNIDILGTFWDSKKNTVSGTMKLFSNFSSAVRFDARYNISYNNLRVDGNADYNNAIIRHNLNCNTQVHLFGRCFFKADYAYTNRYNTRLRRTSQINCLNASLDVRVFSDRKGVISLNAYNVFDSRASITETVEDLGIRSVYNPTNSTLFTISFKYKFGVEQ